MEAANPPLHSATPWTVNPAVADFLGMFGTVTATLMFLSPFKTFLQIVNKRSTEAFDGMPYAMGTLQCSVWVFYALPFITPDRFAPLLTNLIGTSLQLAFALIFLAFATDRERQAKLMMGVVGSLFILGGVVIIIPPPDRSNFLGSVACALCVALYASPLGVLAEVFRTQSVRYMPFLLSAAMFFNALVWVGYAGYVLDYFVLVPNVLGALLSAFQLGVWVWFKGWQQAPAPEGYQPIRD